MLNGHEEISSENLPFIKILNSNDNLNEKILKNHVSFHLD